MQVKFLRKFFQVLYSFRVRFITSAVPFSASKSCLTWLFQLEKNFQSRNHIYSTFIHNTLPSSPSYAPLRTAPLINVHIKHSVFHFHLHEHRSAYCTYAYAHDAKKRTGEKKKSKRAPRNVQLKLHAYARRIIRA